MEWDGKVGAPTLHCLASGRPLAAGERFFSALRASEALFVREDFAEAAWSAIDKTPYVSWWRRTVPVDTGRRQTLKLDGEVLRQLFTDLKDSTSRSSQCFCYVVALCLVRIRALRLRDIEHREGQPYLLLEDRRAECVHRLRDPRMNPDEEDQVRRNLMQVICIDGSGTPAAPAAEATAEGADADDALAAEAPE
jgi:hypothetical protein